MTDDRRSWSDLPELLTSLIFSKLYGKDIAFFHAVCRNWSSVVPLPQQSKHIHTAADHPLLLRSRRRRPTDAGGSCELYSPLYNGSSYLDSGPSFRADAQIHCSNHGWLLLSTGDGREVFFLQPSTGDVVKLTGAGANRPFNHVGLYRMSFSAPPTSPDCVVFAVRVIRDSSSTVAVYFIRRGESTWNSESYTYDYFAHGLIPPPEHDFELHRTGCSPVFHRGAFYCLGQRGELGVFNLIKEKKKKKKWEFVDVFGAGDAFNCETDAYLMADSSSLISIAVGPSGESVKVFEFDRGSNEWRVVSSLGDRAAFLSPATSVVFSCRGLENTIHFARFRGGEDSASYNVFYSLSTGKFHSFDGFQTWNDLRDTELLFNCTWMIPQPLSRLPRPLKWTNIRRKVKPEGLSIRPSYDFFSVGKKSSVERTYERSPAAAARIARPWLVLSHGKTNNVPSNTFLDLAYGKVSLRGRNESIESISRGKEVYGMSPDGHLMLADPSSGHSVLFDTSSMTANSLPSLRILPTNFKKNCCLIHHHHDGNSRFTVVAIFGSVRNGDERRGVTVFCRVGDGEWTGSVGFQAVYAAVSCRGKVYGIGCCNVAAPGRSKKLQLVEMEFEFEPKCYRLTTGRDLATTTGRGLTTSYLVESCGEIFIFEKYGRFGEDPMEVRAYRLDMRTMGRESVDDLGDRAFIFCDRFSRFGGFGCRAGESVFERNCVYFVGSYGDLVRYDYGNRRVSTVESQSLFGNIFQF